MYFTCLPGFTHCCIPSASNSMWYTVGTPKTFVGHVGTAQLGCPIFVIQLSSAVACKNEGHPTLFISSRSQVYNAYALCEVKYLYFN